MTSHVQTGARPVMQPHTLFRIFRAVCTTAVVMATDALADTDQLMLEGVGPYPGSEDTFVPDAELRRAIIGGTRRFKGASGEVLSTHLADGSWTHEFRFGNCKRPG